MQICSSLKSNNFSVHFFLRCSYFCACLKIFSAKTRGFFFLFWLWLNCVLNKLKWRVSACPGRSCCDLFLKVTCCLAALLLTTSWNFNCLYGNLQHPTVGIFWFLLNRLTFSQHLDSIIITYKEKTLSLKLLLTDLFFLRFSWTVSYTWRPRNSTVGRKVIEPADKRDWFLLSFFLFFFFNKLVSRHKVSVSDVSPQTPQTLSDIKENKYKRRTLVCFYRSDNKKTNQTEGSQIQTPGRFCNVRAVV